EGAEDVGGIMHCYNDSVRYVEACLDMNFYISLGGTVTFKNAPLPQEVAAHVPLDRLLIETDAPYLAPHTNRGKRNEPAYVELVAQKNDDIRKITIEKVREVTTKNAFDLFGLQENNR